MFFATAQSDILNMQQIRSYSPNFRAKPFTARRAMGSTVRLAHRKQMIPTSPAAMFWQGSPVNMSITPRSKDQIMPCHSLCNGGGKATRCSIGSSPLRSACKTSDEINRDCPLVELFNVGALSLEAPRITCCWDLAATFPSRPSWCRRCV